MKTYEALVACDPSAYGSITVEADNLADAIAKISRDDIECAVNDIEYGNARSHRIVSIDAIDPETYDTLAGDDADGAEAVDLYPEWEVEEAAKADAARQLVSDLWWFIENVSDDTPDRTDRFFALRERVRELGR